MQLELILRSSPFRQSGRCRGSCRYFVERAAASHVRKRLAEYCKAHEPLTRRIKLPVGSYLPQFVAVSALEPPEGLVTMTFGRVAGRAKAPTRPGWALSEAAAPGTVDHSRGGQYERRTSSDNPGKLPVSQKWIAGLPRMSLADPTSARGVGQLRCVRRASPRFCMARHAVREVCLCGHSAAHSRAGHVSSSPADGRICAAGEGTKQRVIVALHAETR